MRELALGECHQFEAAGRRFLYLVPSAAVFALDEASAAVVDILNDGHRPSNDILSQLDERFDRRDIEASLTELAGARAVVPANVPPAPASPTIIPLTPIPLSTLVVNVTNKCNLSCAYCYEYGEDKIADTTAGGQPSLMSEETAQASVDFMLEQSGASPVARLIFFGGETLLNFPVLQKTIPYARTRAAALGKRVEFSLTTNGTLLRPEIIEFLADNDVGVTISIDGPREMQDKFRVFHDGRGSYDVIAPKVRELLLRHRSRPIGARVTLTSDVLDITRIYRHLTEEIGFWEVGFAPVTTSPGRAHAIGEQGFEAMLAQFRELGSDFLRAALERAAITALATCVTRLRSCTKGPARRFPVGPVSGSWGSRPAVTSRCVTALPDPRRTRSAPCATASTATRSGSSSSRITSTGKPTVEPAGRDPSVRAGATTKPTRATGRPRRPTCTTASGFEAGPRHAWGSTGRSPSATRRSCDSLRTLTMTTTNTRTRGAMTHLTPINRKAKRIAAGVSEAQGRGAAGGDRVVALQDGSSGPPLPQGPHIPLGCSFVFFPGWEADQNGGTAGLCQPVERDLFDCHLGCFWPAQVPDQMNHAPDWTGTCAAAQKDWRKIDLIFP